MKAWKIFTVMPDTTLKFLYHGINGSRIIEFDKWLTADIKQVRDGTGKKYYTSGFHAYLNFRSALKWIAAATKNENRTICPVLVEEWSYKNNATLCDTILAEKLLVPSDINKKIFKELK